MNNKIYAGIRKKIITNIKIIYGNKKINCSLQRIAKSSPYLVNVSKLLESHSLSEYKKYIVCDNDSIRAVGTNSLFDYILNIKAIYNERGDKEVNNFLEKILVHKETDIFDRICVRNKYNPAIWRDFFILRFLGLKINDAYNCVDNIIYHNYLPKPLVIKNRLFIEINELTTEEEVKIAWTEIKQVQREFEKGNGFINQKREFLGFTRGKEISEKIDGKLEFIDFDEKRKKTGYKKTQTMEYVEDTTNKYKIRKKFKNKYLER